MEVLTRRIYSFHSNGQLIVQMCHKNNCPIKKIMLSAGNTFQNLFAQNVPSLLLLTENIIQSP